MQLIIVNVIGSKSFQTSFTIRFDISGRHISSTSDFSCNHDFITGNFTIFHPISNKSFRVTFGCPTAIRRYRIPFGSVDQVHPVFQDCLVLCMLIKEHSLEKTIGLFKAVNLRAERKSAIPYHELPTHVCIWGVKVSRRPPLGAQTKLAHQNIRSSQTSQFHA